MDEPHRQGTIIAKLCEIESTVEHSRLIIDLLTNAYEHYKAQRLSRMITEMAVLMASEYYYVQDYELAKK